MAIINPSKRFNFDNHFPINHIIGDVITNQTLLLRIIINTIKFLRFKT